MTLFGRDSLLTRGWRCRSTSSWPWAPCRRWRGSRARRTTRSPRSSPGASCTRCGSAREPALALGGGSVYYGTVDATPLFVVLLGELRRWGLPGPTVDELLPAADRALEWIERLRRPRRRRFRRVPARDRPRAGEPGLEGLVRRRQLRRRPARRAARSRCARCRATSTPRTWPAPQFADARGDDAAAAAAGRAAPRRSRRAFNERFWLPDRGWFALALDGDKRPVDALASNMGHCLWSGIVDDDKAAAVAEHLLRRRCSAAGACGRWPRRWAPTTR